MKIKMGLELELITEGGHNIVNGHADMTRWHLHDSTDLLQPHLLWRRVSWIGD